MKSKGLFIPRHPIDTVQELQWEIDMAHPENATEIARNAMDVIGDVKDICGAKKLIVHTMSGFVLNRVLTFAEQVGDGHQFDEITLRGDFGGIRYVQQLSQPRLQTFMLDMFDVEILDTAIEEYKGVKMDAPLLVPVLDVQTVLAAN